MRVTEKGQVTIPQNVRRRLGILPGSEVEFAFVEDGALLRLVARDTDQEHSEAQDLLDHIRRHKGAMDLRGKTADEFYRMLRD